MIRLADEVREALAAGGGVVALETTLVAHGFPPGEGVEVGLESERQVREAGAVPATVGVLDGEVRVGLTADELARFGPDARKAGPRDLATAAVQRAVGATTVGGTLVVARAVGIRVLATGGIGGSSRRKRRRASPRSTGRSAAPGSCSAGRRTSPSRTSGRSSTRRWRPRRPPGSAARL